MNHRFAFCFLACLTAFAVPGAATDSPRSVATAWALLRDGRQVEGPLRTETLSFTVKGESRTVRFRDVLSVNLGAPAVGAEADAIVHGLELIQGKDRAACESAVAALADIGLPVISPLLATYKDTDLHEPNPLYRLFARIVPGYADGLDRTQDIVRFANGETLRGRLANAEIRLEVSRKQTGIPLASIRRIAIRRPVISRAVTVEALRHCTQIEFLDTGIRVTPESTFSETAEGFVRLAFDIDGWTTDPDGLKVPGPNYKTNLTDGFPFGALLGRVGPDGPRWVAGLQCEKTGLGSGRLCFAVNDNPHWQNNLGSYRVKLRVTNAYDLSDPQ